MDQSTLTEIVKRWILNPKPEFRGFKCGACGKNIEKAWHYWINNQDYKTPVHLCDACNAKLPIDKLDQFPVQKIQKEKFKELSEKIKKIIEDIVIEWVFETVFKTFSCDRCNKSITRAWHVWMLLENGALAEVHFCHDCGNKLEIKESLE